MLTLRDIDNTDTETHTNTDTHGDPNGQINPNTYTHIDTDSHPFGDGLTDHSYTHPGNHADTYLLTQIN